MKTVVSICAWCQLFKTTQGWFIEKKALPMLGIKPNEIVSDYTLSICPTCERKWTASPDD